MYMDDTIRAEIITAVLHLDIGTASLVRLYERHFLIFVRVIDVDHNLMHGRILIIFT